MKKEEIELICQDMWKKRIEYCRKAGKVFRLYPEHMLLIVGGEENVLLGIQNGNFIVRGKDFIPYQLTNLFVIKSTDESKWKVGSPVFP